MYARCVCRLENTDSYYFCYIDDDAVYYLETTWFGARMFSGAPHTYLLSVVPNAFAFYIYRMRICRICIYTTTTYIIYICDIFSRAVGLGTEIIRVSILYMYRYYIRVFHCRVYEIVFCIISCSFRLFRVASYSKNNNYFPSIQLNIFHIVVSRVLKLWLKTRFVGIWIRGLFFLSFFKPFRSYTCTYVYRCRNKYRT